MYEKVCEITRGILVRAAIVCLPQQYSFTFRLAVENKPGHKICEAALQHIIFFVGILNKI